MNSSIISTLKEYYTDFKNYFTYNDKYKVGNYTVIFQRDTFTVNLYFKSVKILHDIDCFDILSVKNKFLVVRNTPSSYLIVLENRLYQLNLKPNDNVINVLESNKNIITIETNFVKIYYDCIKNSFKIDYTNRFSITEISHEFDTD